MNVEVLWCPTNRTARRNGWAFPVRVARLLQDLTAGKRVVQLFGGRATWGTRLDIDASTTPDVRGDAWLPPFRCNAFDVVVLDPPYIHINQQMKTQLLTQAAYIATESVIWFHTLWIASDARLRLDRAWLVRIGNNSQCRCIQVFRSPVEKRVPVPRFTRGPALRYNRWLDGQMGLLDRKEAES